FGGQGHRLPHRIPSLKVSYLEGRIRDTEVQKRWGQSVPAPVAKPVLQGWPFGSIVTPASPEPLPEVAEPPLVPVLPVLPVFPGVPLGSIEAPSLSQIRVRLFHSVSPKFCACPCSRVSSERFRAAGWRVPACARAGEAPRGRTRE